MPKIGANFTFNSKEPNFKRDAFDTLADMKACDIIDEGHLSWCRENNTRYEFRSSNTYDATTGFWKEFTVSGGGGEAYDVASDSDIDALWTKANSFITEDGGGNFIPKQ